MKRTNNRKSKEDLEYDYWTRVILFASAMTMYGYFYALYHGYLFK